VMMVRRLARHSGDQEFEIISHTALRGSQRASRERSLVPGMHPLYIRMWGVYHGAGTGQARICRSSGSSRQTTRRRDLRHGYGHFRPSPRCWQLVASRSTTLRLAAPTSCVDSRCFDRCCGCEMRAAGSRDLRCSPALGMASGGSSLWWSWRSV
jgi:hypothetical protein